MMSIHEKEEDLFKRWKEFAKSKNHMNFAPDGLLYRGDATTGDEPEGDNWVWGTVPADEEKRWNDARRRLLIVTKDLNDENLTPWDIRIETGFKNTCEKDFDWNICKKFYKNLRMWSYGLLNTDDNGNYPSFEEAFNMDNSAPFYLSAPIARMNVKKECGRGKLYDSVLREHIKTYKNYIIEQLDIYDKADIILACSPIIKDFIIEDYFKKYKKIADWTSFDQFGQWIFYSPSTKKILVNSYHPSNLNKDYEIPYNDMMNPFSKCVKILWGNE